MQNTRSGSVRSEPQQFLRGLKNYQNCRVPTSVRSAKTIVYGVTSYFGDYIINSKNTIFFCNFFNYKICSTVSLNIRYWQKQIYKKYWIAIFRTQSRTRVHPQRRRVAERRQLWHSGFIRPRLGPLPLVESGSVTSGQLQAGHQTGRRKWSGGRRRFRQRRRTDASTIRQHFSFR